MSREEARTACGILLLAAALFCILIILDNGGSPLPSLDLRENQGESVPPQEEEAAPYPSLPEGPLNLNAASLEELTRLPGIGPVLAQRIVDYRQVYGDFSALEELKEVAGIGEKKFRELEDYLTVE